jgi:hypothetical protein
MPVEAQDRPNNAENRPRNPGFFARIGAFDRRFTFVRGLSIVTLVSSVFVTYFQYLNAYQDKVSNQAKEDMKSVAETFAEASSRFSDIFALQQILYSDFTRAVRGKSDASTQALGSKNALEVSKAYEKERIELHEKIDVLVRKAEMYIDRSSNSDRDPAAKHNVEDDPLSRTLLRDYRFDCSDPYTFPRFGNVNAKAETPVQETPDRDFCVSGQKQEIDDRTAPQNAFIRICPGKQIDSAVRIYWYSAKHHLLTMHYCFEKLHDRLEPARQWASNSDRDAVKEMEIMADAGSIDRSLDGLALRLNSFNSLALHQMERIRVKYRPLGFICSVPLVRNGFSDCFPLKTTDLLPASIREASQSMQSSPPRDQLVISSRYPTESR